ncbi:membrane protein FxsA [Vallitalea longa]|uniref:Membrane protein FxsA n=1 Tax=Vallitalea longa TaxID=2936439 RepID=A0A9W6DDR7_9FIRM|nr:FxsA family protein [Vallitalea longa]GKX29296.1 membrane protein FxsA [Vallitalea longa]
MKLTFGKLLLLFTIVPFVELYILLKLANVTSAGITLLIIVITGIIGAYFAKHQGRAVIKNIQYESNNGHMPGNELMHGLCVLIGGILLVTPGIITDLFGFSLLFPLTRTIYVNFIKKYFLKKFETGSINFYTSDRF